MANFLTLVQDTERESGTMPSLLSTVTNATGRHGRFVAWVEQAWTEIQMERADWRWMRHEFSGSLIAGTATYDPGALGITNFGAWVFDTSHDRDFSLYVTADGQDTEGHLRFVPWDQFRRDYGAGPAATQTGTPAYITVTPGDDLKVWPKPDAACTLRGEYVQTPQVLSADADIPDMPTRFHHLIRLKALLKMAVFDEAMAQYPVWQREFGVGWNALLRAQTPRLKMAGPLA